LKPICFIAARAGSKGILNKNIKIVGGKPLISYAIESAKKSKLFEHIIVSTDSQKIKNIALKYGAEVPFMRPKKLAGDKTGIIPVILHGINSLKSLGYSFDVVVIRDCTVPFIVPTDLRGVINLLKKIKCDGVFAVYKQHHNPYFNMVESNKNSFLKISKNLKKEIISRQDAPTVYQVNGLFAFYVDSLIKHHTFLMPKIIPYEISQESGFMIDTKFELKIAELIFRKN
jgi:CMP-N,N'-diacetyllegionaminic acid synthase